MNNVNTNTTASARSPITWSKMSSGLHIQTPMQRPSKAQNQTLLLRHCRKFHLSARSATFHWISLPSNYYWPKTQSHSWRQFGQEKCRGFRERSYHQIEVYQNTPTTGFLVVKKRHIHTTKTHLQLISSRKRLQPRKLRSEGHWTRDFDKETLPKVIWNESSALPSIRESVV